MKILEILKLGLYLIILLVALAVLKWLSTFEYELRDKTITYEEIFVEEYEQSVGLLDKLKGKEKVKAPSILSVSLQEKLSGGKRYCLLDSIASIDSGYIELKYKTDATVNKELILTLIDKQQIETNVCVLTKEGSVFSTCKTDIIAFGDFDKLCLRSASITIDTLHGQNHQGTVDIDYLKVVKQIRPQELF